MKNFSAAIILVLLISSCMSINRRGKEISDKMIDGIKISHTTKDEVLEALGTPSFIADKLLCDISKKNKLCVLQKPNITDKDNTYYYISRLINTSVSGSSRVGFQKIVALTISNNIVSNIQIFEDENLDNIKIITYETQVEETNNSFIKRYINNFGKFSRKKKSNR
jgi:outer membrane protein assembly factor BamE (lipoprotein component of BamABCDE complex)